jgi:hypothetical protein
VRWLRRGATQHTFSWDDRRLTIKRVAGHELDAVGITTALGATHYTIQGQDAGAFGAGVLCQQPAQGAITY